MPLTTDWSELAVAQVQGRSRLITCRNLQPLKILNPTAPSGSCHAVLSSYGGGMVAGDVIQLRITGGADTRLFVSSQSNTKIFKSIDGQVAEQHIAGELAEGALAVVFPDPVVPQAGSRYRQIQHWNIAPNALLLVADWLHSGRMDIGEKFEFHSFFSELHVRHHGRLTLLDRFAFSPDKHIATSPANFSTHQTVLSLYLVGSPADPRFTRLAALFQQLKLVMPDTPQFDLSGHSCLISVTQAKADVYVLRAAAHSRHALQPLCTQVLDVLAEEQFFGYNPLARKY
ncbi:urease accessory protein UreD [Hymenobacter tibetensis]|uniref:Urease accessory protein UreD n=1 Tax=Hymenobacter tibetensis TaxID=497967 RepID=A0ABY4CS81_9BACT|nr:urease accessory protein UreD [Hymenobacter tibetensis]UOG73113.1 urease accessory protein UreD [Hymenobacter tibetensis]